MWLHIYSPLLRIQPKYTECSLLHSERGQAIIAGNQTKHRLMIELRYELDFCAQCYPGMYLQLAMVNVLNLLSKQAAISKPLPLSSAACLLTTMSTLPTARKSNITLCSELQECP